jgi:hypothetical protein
LSHPSEKPNHLVHPDHNFKSVPVLGDDGETAYEGSDAPPKVVVWSLGIVALLAAFGFVLIIGLEAILKPMHPTGDLPSPLSPARVVPPAPQLEVHPWDDVPAMRAHEQDVLNLSGKDKDGHFHVPIGQAMGLVVTRLNVRPDSPQGLTTPGGTDNEFSHSLADMPAAYQRPAIQGEIRKNAQ